MEIRIHLAVPGTIVTLQTACMHRDLLILQFSTYGISKRLVIKIIFLIIICNKKTYLANENVKSIGE